MLTLIATVSVLWLGVRGQLEYYVHPRYVVFEIVMAGLAVVLAVAAIVAPRTRRRGADHDHDHHDHHDHDHDHGDASPAARARRAVAGPAAVAILAAVLLVLPPSTLTSATAQQRDLNAGIPLSEELVLSTGDDRDLTIKDWAMLMRIHDVDFFTARTPFLEGMVVPDPRRPDVFYVTRFVVTCCAVDARPVGVPVLLPGWQERYAVDSWVRVEGDFTADDGADTEPVVVVPTSTEQIERPDAPYLD